MIAAISKWKVALYLAGIFATGSVSGWVVATTTARPAAFQPPQQQENAVSWRDKLHSKLNLDPEQKKQVDVILERSSAEVQSLHNDSTKLIRQAMAGRNAQITALLTPEQQRQFEQMEKDRRGGPGKDSWRNKGRNSAKPDADRLKEERSDSARKDRRPHGTNNATGSNCPPNATQ